MGNPVYRGLVDLGSSISGGLRDIGQNRLRSGQLDLARAMQGFQIGQQKEAGERAAKTFAYQEPSMRLAQEEALNKEKYLNSPFTPQSAFKDPIALVHGIEVPKERETSVWDEWGKVFQREYGAKWDPKNNVYVKSDGTPVTNRDKETHSQELAMILFGRTNPLRTLEDEAYRKQSVLAGLQPNDPRAKQLQADIQKISGILSDNGMKLKILERQREILASQKGEGFQKEAERVGKQIDSIRSEMAKAGEKREAREWEKSKLEFQEGSKNLRTAANIKAAKDIQAQKQTQTGTKLTDSQKAEIDLLKSDYRSAESIIREYRKGSTSMGFESNISPAEAAKATRRKMEILAKIKKFGLTKADLEKQEPEEDNDPLGLFKEEEE
jgi:hypothetical protein